MERSQRTIFLPIYSVDLFYHYQEPAYGNLPSHISHSLDNSKNIWNPWNLSNLPVIESSLFESFYEKLVHLNPAFEEFQLLNVNLTDKQITEVQQVLEETLLPLPGGAGRATDDLDWWEIPPSTQLCRDYVIHFGKEQLSHKSRFGTITIKSGHYIAIHNDNKETQNHLNWR